MAGWTVVLDACVLYPAPLRDLLMWLALRDLFRPRWTDAIHEEWISNLLRNRPSLTRVQLERTRALMNAAVPDCLVSGYESLIPTLSLPDPDDRHVLAAAIQARASALVTFNLPDFPPVALEAHGVELLHPDAFLGRLLDQAPDEVCAAMKQHRLNLRNPPKDVPAYLQTLEQLGLPRAIERLRSAADQL